MDYKGISSSELADTIGVQRSNVTHVLHGRNMPSFQFISKLLETYPEINAKWLIMGSGGMLEQGTVIGQQQLFPENEKINQPEKPATVPPPVDQAEAPPVPPKVAAPVAKQPPVTQNKKEIERIVVFYSDQTFKEYGPSI
jgi:transcriptional regulator with XRE-family HTH domain